MFHPFSSLACSGLIPLLSNVVLFVVDLLRPLVRQFGLNFDSPSITCFCCAALITCSTRLHLLLICIYISSLQQTVSTHQGQTDNCIGWKVKFNLETNPYSNDPKVKVNLTAGAYWSKQWQLAEDGLQAHIVWAQIHGGKRKKRLNLSLKNF